MIGPARSLLLLLCGCAAAGGCQLFTASTEISAGGTNLPPVRLAPDSVTLDLLFIRVSAEHQAELDEAWRSLDEQQLSPETRQRLAENGIRCGLAGLHLPALLAQSVLEQQSATNASGESLVEGEVSSKQRRLHARAGNRSEVVLTPTLPSLSLLTRSEGQVSGRSFTEAQGRLAMLAYPRGDGNVRLEITPEIHYGPTRNRWIGRDGMFRLESGNERHLLAELKTIATLGPGDTLVFSCTGESIGLGRDLFIDETESPAQTKLLLIRLSQTRADDLHNNTKTPVPVELRE